MRTTDGAGQAYLLVRVTKCCSHRQRCPVRSVSMLVSTADGAGKGPLCDGLPTAMATVPCAAGLCSGADCRRRRKRRPVRPPRGLPTAPAAGPCAFRLCAGSDCERLRKRRPGRPRGDCRRPGPRCLERQDSFLVCTALVGVSSLSPPAPGFSPSTRFWPTFHTARTQWAAWPVHHRIKHVRRAARPRSARPSASAALSTVAAWPHVGHLDLTADGAIKWKAHRRTRR